MFTNLQDQNSSSNKLCPTRKEYSYLPYPYSVAWYQNLNTMNTGTPTTIEVHHRLSGIASCKMLPPSSFIICLESGCSIAPSSADYILSLANGDFHLPLHCPATGHNLNETDNFKTNRRKILCFNALPSFYLDKATSQPPHQKRGLKILSCIFGHFKAQDTATLSILVMMKKLSTA